MIRFFPIARFFILYSLEVKDKEDFKVSGGKYSWDLVHDVLVGIVAHAKVDKCSGFVE